ncbi:hypothetical protein [Mucilaginibacter auburnensis]|uniref:hypothetical protein n=1 Tax=Mucilaginibacter auburnensis TaxID=1457233 RepID=UPI0014744DD0|nr:hypothetical protein [Mucilaginibacter auburnensis]
MEEKLWEYIDGTCNEQDKATIAGLIESDEQWRNAFNSMLEMESELSAVTLEEPTMAFSYNVMEAIRNEQAAKPLKTKINKYIITSIAGVLLLTLGILSFLLFEGAMRSIGNHSLDIHIQQINSSALINSTAWKAFIYFDIMLLLFFADRLIRRRSNDDVVKSV